MNGLEITGIVVGAIIILAILASAKDIVRYIHISTM
jgi:hypothetical protein